MAQSAELYCPAHNVAESETSALGRTGPGLFLMTNNFEMGGSERQFILLTQSFEGRRFRVEAGCLAKRGSLAGSLSEVTEFPIGRSLYSARSFITRFELARYLHRRDIAIAHSFDLYSNLTLIPAARIAGCAVVIGSQRQLGDLLSPAKARAQTVVLRWCDSVVCNSHAAAKGLMGRGIEPRRIVVIGNGLAPSAFARAEPALRRNAGVLRVCMIARMNTPSKNHGMFLRAAAEMQPKFPEVEYVLVGDGPLRPQLEREAAELGVRHVYFLGERHDIPAILASVDISVLPSSSESLSNVILESMAAGVPVVATGVGGNPEVISTDRGILVEANEPTALTSAIEHLLGNPSVRADFGRNARKFAETTFTIAAVRKQYEDLYVELLGRKKFKEPRRLVGVSEGSVTKRLHVAIVAPSLRYVGGQAAQAESLLQSWKDDPAIFAELIPIDPPFPTTLKWAESVRFLRTLLREPIYILTLWRGLRRAEIAHAFSASYWSFILATLPAWVVAGVLGKKVIIHYHSGEARDHLGRSRIAKHILPRADRLIVPSGYLASVFAEHGFTAQVVPNVIDACQFRFRTRRPLRPHLLCTRGFHPYYRIDLVLKAFAEIQLEFPEARLDLVGQGPLELEIRELAKDLRLSGVNFAGVASRQNIGKHYEAGDIFINASSVDNMPVSILEAFASGMPVVSTAAEGITFMIEHERTGLLSPPGDAQALAGNVVRLLRDPALASQIAHNAHEESNRYSWDAVRPLWLEVYDSLASDASQSRSSAA
jgi:L-malate glycosyltransferase